MAKRQRFPRLIHVIEEDGEHDEHWLQVVADGVLGVDEPGRPIAIYKLVKVGRVNITKKFVKVGK